MTTSIFFYSSYCQHCKQIINELTKSPLARSIKYVCIDSRQVREKIPEFITSVPTMVVGDTNQVLVGNHIKSWLETKIPKMESVNVKNIPSVPTEVQIQECKQSGEGPGAWHSTEMNNFSDMYSFIGIDTSAQGDGGMSMVHNFELLSDSHSTSNTQELPAGAPGRPSIPTQYDMPMKNGHVTSDFGSIQVSEKSEQLNKQMEELLSRRESDVPNRPARV